MELRYKHPQDSEQRNAAFPPFHASQGSSLTLNQQEIMDLKVLLLCIVKALREVFLTPPATQEQWEQFQVGWCGFFGTVFPEILVRHCLPSTETPHTSTASSSINAVQEEPIEITPNFTPHQDWTHPKLPQRMGISSLDVLLH